jgi:hypothetical protein
VVAVGSPTGSRVGTLTVASLLVGQYLPPLYRLPGNVANNSSFTLVAAPQGGALLLTAFQAASAGQQAYLIAVHVDIGFGDGVYFLQVSGPPPGSGSTQVSEEHPIVARLVPVRLAKKKTRLMVRVFDADTGAELKQFLSVFQAPAYKSIVATAFDSNGDGIPDEVRLTARKGKKKVSRVFAVLHSP